MSNYQIQINEADLPVLSVVATQALKLMSDPDVTNQKIEALIRQDPSLTSQVLHIANSPFFAACMQTRSIASAASRLGIRQLRNIVVAAATGELFNAEDPAIQAIWHHSLETAYIAQQIAVEMHLSFADDAYVAGLLHDVGKMMIFQKLNEVYSELVRRAMDEDRRIVELEIETFEHFNHMSVAGLAIRKWKLGDGIAEAARYHHNLEIDVPKAMEHPKLACVVSAANLISHGLIEDEAIYEWEDLPSLPCFKEIGLTLEKLNKIRTAIDKMNQSASA